MLQHPFIATKDEDIDTDKKADTASGNNQLIQKSF